MGLIRIGARGRHRISREGPPRMALVGRPRRWRTWGLAAALVAGSIVPVAGALASPAGAAVTHAGSCNGFSGAQALGASYTDSTVTVPTCGPQPMLGGKKTTVYPYTGGRGIPGYQCVEFSERYLYYKFGVKTLAATNGDQVVDHYAAWDPSLFKAISNGTVGEAPVEGDVLSFSNASTFNGSNGGHTAVVQSSSVNSAGNGSVLLIEENGGNSAANGSQLLTISGWKVQYSPHPLVKWLHRIGKPALPAEPTNARQVSTTTNSAVITWTNVASNATTIASQYRIANGAWTNGPSVSASQTSMTVGGLQPGKRYTFQVGARNAAGTHWSAYFYVSTQNQSAPPPPPPAPTGYHAGHEVTVDVHATGGDSGHKGPGNSYAAGPTHPARAGIWIVCYVNGQSITGPYGTETIWDLGDDGYYYSDAWLYTGTNGAVVPACSLKNVTVVSQATGGDSGHTGPGNAYAAGPTHPAEGGIQIACYVNGQSIAGPYGTESIWDLSTDGYYYSDAWLYTGTNGAAVRTC